MRLQSLARKSGESNLVVKSTISKDRTAGNNNDGASFSTLFRNRPQNLDLKKSTFGARNPVVIQHLRT